MHVDSELQHCERPGCWTYLPLFLQDGALLNHILQHLAPLRRLSDERIDLPGLALQVFLLEDARLERTADLVGVLQYRRCFVVERHCKLVDKVPTFFVLGCSPRR